VKPLPRSRELRRVGYKVPKLEIRRSNTFWDANGNKLVVYDNALSQWAGSFWDAGIE